MGFKSILNSSYKNVGAGVLLQKKSMLKEAYEVLSLFNKYIPA